MSDSEGEGGAFEECCNWIRERTHSCYRHIKEDKFNKGFNAAETQALLKEFVTNADTRCLVFTGDQVKCSLKLPKEVMKKGKGVYFLKSKATTLTPKNVTQLLFAEVTKDPLIHLEQVLEEVYVPLLANPRNQEGWGEVISKEVMDKVYGLLANITITVGQTQGKTCLPLPPLDLSSSALADTSKERVYLLESAVITWTRQIRNVLKQDPEQLLKQGLHPTPNVEIQFWKSKAANLNSIFEQLQGERVRRVLKFLDQSKSTYCSPFAKLCKDVFQARVEANDNVKYLTTLEDLVEKLTKCPSGEFASILDLFKPIMHTILLIWKHSQHYNSPSRLVVLMREICNAIINQACGYLSGEQIFDLLEEEGSGPQQALNMLKTTLKVCGTFKSTYFDYKARSSVEVPHNAWRIQNNALFLRLDSFLERCHDILDLTQTIVQFDKLERIEIGGTKGKTLTTSVQQIFADFKQVVDKFKGVPYDIMDVGAKQFDDDFYEFRCRIKELERRLGSVITQSFDDSATIFGQFKLLDSFAGLLERPIIHDELEKKHGSLIRAYNKDLQLVGDIFLQERQSFDETEGGAADGNISRNMPPIAGSLGWCRALQERIQEPMEKLLKLSNVIMDKDEGKEVVKTYKATMSKLQEFESKRVAMLGADVETTSLAKLKQTLMKREPDSKLLIVNFDPGLVALLREVKYFLLAGLDVPESAFAIYNKVEIFRQYTGKLDIMVNSYNNMLNTMIPVEAPLMGAMIADIDKSLRAGLEVMNWKSHGIDAFLEKCNVKVQNAAKVLSTLKQNVKTISEMLRSWSEESLFFQRNGPALTVNDYNQEFHQYLHQRFDSIKKDGQKIHVLLNESNKILRVSKGLPDWKAYVQYVSGVVIEGMSKLVVVSFEFLLSQIDKDVIGLGRTQPMIEIECHLFKDAAPTGEDSDKPSPLSGKKHDVCFMPDIYETGTKDGIRDTVNMWMSQCFQVGNLFNRLERTDVNADYISDIRDKPNVQALMDKIKQNVTFWEEKCEVFRNTFDNYKYLWVTDLQKMIAEFIAESTTKLENGETVPDIDKFDDWLQKFQVRSEPINHLDPHTTIGWLFIRCDPLKQALKMCVSKWKYCFTYYLSKHVLTTLNTLHTFMSDTRRGLQEEVSEDDQPALIRVMTCIRDVRTRMTSTKEIFKPLRATIAILKSYGIEFEDELIDGVSVQDYLDMAPAAWDSTVNLTFEKKEMVLPIQNGEADRLKLAVEEYYDGLREFWNNFRKNAPFKFKGEPKDAYKMLDRHAIELKRQKELAAEFQRQEDLFELPSARYKELRQCSEQMGLLKTLWDFKAMVMLTRDAWKDIKWKVINTDDLETQTNKMSRYIKTLGNNNTVVKGWMIFKDIEGMCKNLATVLPLVNELHSPAMRERHWKSLAAVCSKGGERVKINHQASDFKLNDLLKLDLHNCVVEVQDVVETATKELKIEQKLTTIEAAWTSMELEFIPFKNTGVKIVKVPDDVVENLEGHSVELQSIVGMGKFVDFFRGRVMLWQSNLGQVELILKMWGNVTKQWGSLEAIFLKSDDIRKQMPEVTKVFENVNKDFKNLMTEAVKYPNCVAACTRPNMEELMRDNLIPNLERCQKALLSYLDKKKKIFPRFYFVSDVALLDILSNGNDPPSISHYVGDCFGDLNRVVFKDDDHFVCTHMQSKDGEQVAFAEIDGPGSEEIFKFEGQVENYMNDLSAAMKKALRVQLADANDTALSWEHETPRHKWLFNYPAQVVLTSTLIYWTEEAELSLQDFEGGTEDAVKNYEQKCTTRLSKLIGLVQGKLSKADRTKIIALITMDVHSRDVIAKLVRLKVDSTEAFEWKQQMRYYWLPEQRDVDIRICDFFSKYTYEYIGNTGRLVITPLTDRCYITLTMALRLMLGGAPAGPAGTGKTETTKDLARALALPIYVFNCSDQMNYVTMANIFKGLSQTGAWGCFDEFNRIPIEVLSVVATQVKSVLDAIVYFCDPNNREEKWKNDPAAGQFGTQPGQPPCVVGEFKLQGDTIRLVPTTGFFITMNPGYAGRTELPENLKALFRSCAMIRPDLEPICENMLMAEGFETARVLATKFVKLYALAEQLCSPQPHYDWGLRNVKSVLRVAGMLKRAAQAAEATGQPPMTEEVVLMRALRDFNTPKMPSHDVPVFLRLIEDLFPASYKTLAKVDKELGTICRQYCKANGLQGDSSFVLKVSQFQELLDVRHSVMLIGPAGSAKTQIWKALLGSWNYGYRQPKNPDGSAKKSNKAIAISKIVNPKSITSDELYGFMTLAKEWKDGVLSIIMRGMSKNFKELGYQETQQYKWVVLDGDIDAVWIESMNTVMDDNKVLTLVSNERVPLSDAMRMVFEINSLANATPATVSRAGILFINETDVGWQPFVDSWINMRESASQQQHLPTYFKNYIESIEKGCRKIVKNSVPIRIINQVSTICYLLESLLGNKDFTPEVMESAFCFAAIWAFGGCLLRESWEAFDAFWNETFKNIKIVKEKGGSIFNYYYDVDNNDFVEWKTMVHPWNSMLIGDGPGDSSYSSIYVDDVESVRLRYLLHNLVMQQRPVLFVGTAGTGKSAIMKSYLRQMGLEHEQMTSKVINMNYYMNAQMLQQQIEGAIDKRSGSVFGPPPGKKIVILVDDLNLPYVEEYGTQNSLALLRQVMDSRTFFDRTDLGFLKQLTDVQFLGAMNPTAGSFNINERVQRHFATFTCDMPNAESLESIFKQIFMGHVTLRNFSKEVQEFAPAVVKAVVDLHSQIMTKFMPSAIKFVYNWNMRELSNIFRGLTLSQPENFKTKESMVKLWVHEVTRVFSDRMISEADVARFQKFATSTAERHFLLDDVSMLEDSQESPLIFTSFHVESATPAYQAVNNFDKLRGKIENVLEEYNESNAVMNLVLFKQAVQHVTRITRIIKNPSGNAMLVGVGGSGKQSLSKLSAFICEYPVKTVALTSSYGVEDFKEHIRECIKASGQNNQPIVFLITDAQIVDDKFLIYINDILSSGWIPQLYAKDEVDGIFGAIRKAAKSEGIPDTPEDNLRFLAQRIRNNFHIILCFSPVGDSFRNRARCFPGLINCTNIDHFHPWPEMALVSVAQRFLADVELENEEMSDNLAYHMAHVHISVMKKAQSYLESQRRKVYVTPKSYLELISFYKSLLAEKRQAANELIERLDCGLSTLAKTEADVNELKNDLKITMVKVEEKKKATDALLEQMGKQRGEATEQQEKAEVEQAKSKVASDEAGAIEKEAEQELSLAQPALDEAAGAVDCLSKASLTELKSMKQPPTGVDKVTACCLIMLEKEFKNHKWARAKKMMGNIGGFLERLKTFDAENMADKVINALEPIVNDPALTVKEMMGKSAAAANLWIWVTSIFKFNRIYVKVKPLMERLEAARATKQAAMDKLDAVTKLLKRVQDQLEQLTTSYVEATAEKQAVEDQAEACQNRLGLANRLINGLSSEKKRWSVEVEQLQAGKANLVGDCLLAAAFCSYIGGFDAQYRKTLWEDDWIPDLNEREIPTTPGVDPLPLLANESNQARMQGEGLPADRVSLENGGIMTNCKRWPLVIDPQLQGVKWLRSRYGDEKYHLQVTQLNDKFLMRTLKNALQNGWVVIIENIGEEIDAALDPILARSIFKKGRNWFLKMGEETVEFDSNFQLFLVTKYSNPDYKPEIQAQTTLINFIATEQGLEDQLLARVVQKEEPELELSKKKLQAQFNKYKIDLLALEDELLERLANAPEDILSDVPLIEGLENTKKTASEIKVAVEKGKEVGISINKKREFYRPVACEGSMLYFILTRLNLLDHMYQYSLDAFVKFFYKAIKNSPQPEKEGDIEGRVVNLKQTLRETIYTWVSRGLFEKHKLILLCQITFTLMRRQKLPGVELNMSYFNFLIRRPKKTDEDNQVAWLPNSAWYSICALGEFDEFSKLPQDINEASSRFMEWFNHVTPETEKLPLDWGALDKTPFLKLLVISCLRPDRMTVGLSTFVRNTLPNGSLYVDCDAEYNSLQVLSMSLADSDPTIPIYFILSPGADVMSDLDKAALQDEYSMKKGETYHNVSMGQGQDIIAEERLNTANSEGHWVILNNVHLMPRWLTKLEKMMDDFAILRQARIDECMAWKDSFEVLDPSTWPSSDCDVAGSSAFTDKKIGSFAKQEKFRLFLTSDPSKSIPPGVLNRSIKLTFEPPSGMKANLKRAWCSFNKNDVDEMDKKCKSILFGLCHFHSLMMERKKFGPKGFNMVYPFSLGDLRDSSACLMSYMADASGSIPWIDLQYIFGQIMYGGHIVNDFDRLLCMSYLEYFMEDNLLDEHELIPFCTDKSMSFKSPNPTTYDRYLAHIDSELKTESPALFGLHPNAEIDFRTTQSVQLFDALEKLAPKEQATGDDDEDVQSPTHVAENAMAEILERFEEDAIIDLDMVDDILEGVRGPFQNVFIQECDQMNKLLATIIATLKELELGFKGELTMSDPMEALLESLYMNKVPAVWSKLAWPSQRPLASWLENMSKRIVQLRDWTENPLEIPKVTWISGVINPQSFLTAIMQETAQRNSLELDKLMVYTEVTKIHESATKSRDGAYVIGMSLEGARWDTDKGELARSKPREMYYTMPLVICKAVSATTSVSGTYTCPVYKTDVRGPTFVFCAQLKTKLPPACWVMSGVAILLDVVE